MTHLAAASSPPVLSQTQDNFNVECHLVCSKCGREYWLFMPRLGRLDMICECGQTITKIGST